MAMLAALPKAPSTYNPYRNSIRALKRRNWVLKRLLDERFINVEFKFKFDISCKVKNPSLDEFSKLLIDRTREDNFG